MWSWRCLSDLEISLIKIQPTIGKAENMWIKDENLRQNVNKLLVLLKDAAYDAEDLLDKFQFQKLQQQIEQQGNEASDASSSSFLSFPSRPMKKRKAGEDNDHDDVTEIRKIQEKLDNISNAMKDLLDSDNRGKVQMISEINRVTGSTPVETKVFGRDNELNELMRFLLEQDQAGSGSGSNNNTSVLTVIGMGGVGKTTLAQEAYNDKRVQEYFTLRIWVHVSEDFSVERLTKEIIENTTKQKCDPLNFDALQVVLKEKITSKKFLLVLDDVWNEDRRKWDSLCAPLRSGVTGSKILVTTRNAKIANMVGSVKPTHLHGLDDDSCWEFFQKCAFGSQNSRDHPRLQAIAKEMVPKLKGLPLAVRTLGGLLNLNMNEQHWKTVMDSEIWKLPQEENGLLLVLQLSYQYLPAQLKRCFAFCSLCPKDYLFEEHELVRIWMAEGFFPAQQNIMIEDFGSACFQELVSRSFFQKSQWKNGYVMHDLLHDLAQLISVGEMYRLEDGKPFEISTMLRHLNIVSTKEDKELRRMMEFHDFNKLRTLIYARQCSFMKSVLTCGLNRLRSVRTLILKNCGLTEFPESIGVFIHLRYLNISGNAKITELPNSLFKLYNLQTLILDHCGLYVLPDSIGNLSYLRYLDITCNKNLNMLPKSLCCLSNLQTLVLRGCDRLQSLPQDTSRFINLRKLDANDNLVTEITDVGQLTSLRSLSIFKVGKEHGGKLAELSGLTQLHGTLTITSLENVESKEEAIAARLQSKVQLDELVLRWTRDQDNDAFSDSQEQVLEHLQPNSMLKRLMISGYSGARSPSWLEAESLLKLETLSLEDCKRWDDLSFIRKLPPLKSLLLKRLPGVKQIRQELFGSAESNSFLELEKFVLELEDMSLLEGLPILGELPYLKFLCIPRMSQLEIDYALRGGLGKNWLPSLEVLELQDTMGKELPLLVQLPSLKVLRLGGMTAVKEITHELFGFTNHLKIFPILKELKISNMPVCQGWSCSDDTEWFPCLIFLEIDNCPLLRRLPPLPPSLTMLTLNQVGLTEFPGIQDGTDGSSRNIATVFPLEIRIRKCPNLTCLDRIKCFPCLEYLCIMDCPLLTRLPPLPPLSRLQLNQVGLTELSVIGGSCRNITTRSLSWLYIEECSNMISLEQGLLSCNLSKLAIISVRNCGELLRMPVKKFKECTSLNSLSIVNCPKLMSMAQDDDIHLLLPPSICRLNLSNCGKVERSLPGCLHNLTTLIELKLRDCPHFVPISREALLHLEQLKSLCLLNYKELRCMEALGVLKSLKKLKIHGCPKLQLKEGDGQGENIFSLIELNVDNTALLRVSPLRRTLPSIKSLIIKYSLEVNMFEEEDQELLRSLTSLQYLKFYKCKNLQSLSTGWHTLPSLMLLEIDECTQIQSLPEKGLPISLINIRFFNCHSTLEKQLEEHLAEMKKSGRLYRIGPPQYI